MVQANAIELHFKNTIASANERVYAVNKDGSLYYWGKGTDNDVVEDQSPERSKPVKLMDEVIGVYGDWWSGFAIKSDNTLWAIGSSGDGKGGSKKDTDPPVKIMDGVKEAACSYGQWLLLKTDGTVWYWSYVSKDGMRQILTDVKQISAGLHSFYAVKNDGTLWGWGNNYSGELGVKTGNVEIYSPIKIMDNVTSVCGSGMSAFAVKTDGTLWGWGDNDNVAVYTGTNETWAFDPYPDGSQSIVEAIFTPVKLMDDVRKVAGRRNIAAIKQDNTLWVWGANEAGQLGDGTTASHDKPIKLLEDVLDVTANSGNTIALKKDGTLWGCGTNAYGELGIGSFDNDVHPKLIKIMDDVALPGAVCHIPSSWARDDVNRAIQLELVPAELQSHYEKGITRGEFVSLIANVLRKVSGKDLKDLISQKENLIDIKLIDTTDEDILNIAKLGLINGVGNNKFDPDGLITREQAAKILMDTSKLLGLPMENDGGNFADEGAMSEWAREGVYFCYAQGIMKGTGDNNFSPAKEYSREMSIITIMRLHELLSKDN